MGLSQNPVKHYNKRMKQEQYHLLLTALLLSAALLVKGFFFKIDTSCRIRLSCYLNRLLFKPYMEWPTVLLKVFSCVVYKISQQPSNQNLLNESMNHRRCKCTFSAERWKLCTCGFFDIPQRHPQTQVRNPINKAFTWNSLKYLYLTLKFLVS